MADINSNSEEPESKLAQAQSRPDTLDSGDGEDMIAFVELLFFAYRDFTGEPDALLDDFGFGRAHHRVLHFVNRNPGLCVADLLDVLKITKQSLARVLKQLIDDGFIAQQAGASDRRQRLLFVTERGEALARKLAELQIERIRGALAAAGPDAKETVHKFLLAVVSPEERATVSRLIERQGPQGANV